MPIAPFEFEIEITLSNNIITPISAIKKLPSWGASVQQL